MKNKKGLYVLFVMSFFIATIIIWSVYKTDTPSTVTVQNGNTEVYNGVSIGDVVMALVSIAVTALLGLVTYLQTQVSIEIDTWEKTPFLIIKFKDSKYLDEQYNAMVKEVGDRESINAQYDYLIKQVEESNEDDGTLIQELLDEKCNALGPYEFEHNLIELFYEVSKRYPGLKYIIGEKGRGIYDNTFVSEIEINNLTDIEIFSIDVFNVEMDGKTPKKVYVSNFAPYVKNVEGMYEGFCNIPDKQEENELEFLIYLEKEYIMPHCSHGDKYTFITFSEDEFNCVQAGKTLDKFIGFDIKTSNGYEYTQVTKLSLKCVADKEDCLMLVVVAYNTELHKNKINVKELKKIIKKLDNSQEERRKRLDKKRDYKSIVKSMYTSVEEWYKAEEGPEKACELKVAMRNYLYYFMVWSLEKYKKNIVGNESEILDEFEKLSKKEPYYGQICEYYKLIENNAYSVKALYEFILDSYKKHIKEE